MAEASTPVAPPSPRSTGSLVMLLLFARVAAAAMSAAIGMIVPHYLNMGDAASYGIVVGVALMFVVLTDLGLTTSTARALAEGRVNGSLWRRVALLRAGSALAGAAVFFAVAMALRAGVVIPGVSSHNFPPTLVMAGGALIIAASLSGVAAGLLPTLRRVHVLLVVTVVQPMLEFGGVVLAVLLGVGASGIVLASTAAALVAGTVGIVAVARGIDRREVDNDAVSDLAAIRAYGWPMFLVAISFTAFGQVDQLVLYATRSTSEAATYIWSWRLVTLLHMPGLAAATIVAPRLARLASASGDDAVLAAARRNLFAGWLRLLVVVYLGMAVLSAALAPWLVPVALGSRYAAHWSVFASLTLYAALLGVAPLVTMSANFLGGAGTRVRLGFVTIGLNLALDLVLIPRYGTVGAAIGTSVAFSWYVIAHAVLSWRLLGGTVLRSSGPVPVAVSADADHSSAATRAAERERAYAESRAGGWDDDESAVAGAADSQADGDSPTRAITRLRNNLALAFVTVASAAFCGMDANLAARTLDGPLGNVGALLISGFAFAGLYAAVMLSFSYLWSLDLVGVAFRVDDEPDADDGDPREFGESRYRDLADDDDDIIERGVA